MPYTQTKLSVSKNFEKVMQSVSTFFKEENDFLYRKGQAKGEEKKGHIVVKNLILNSALSDKDIAEHVEVGVNYVRKIRTELTGK